MGILKLFNSCTLTEKILVGVLSLAILISAFQIGNAFYLKNSEPTPTDGGTFVEGVVGEFNFLNPVLAQTNLDRDLTSLIFCGLTRFDPVENAVVDAIADHELSADQRTYTFHIREGVRWQDGVPVTADDVIFTFKDVIQSPDFPNPAVASDFAGVEITKIDDMTVAMTLQKKYAFFIYNTTVGLLPKHILKDLKPSELLGSDFNLNPVGCGPYSVDSIGANAIRLSAFDDFYRGRPYIDSVIFRIFPNENELLKNLDGILGTKDLSEKSVKSLANDARLALHDFTLPQYVGLFFNTERPILSDKKLRLGLQLATNKEDVAKAQGGRVKIIDTPLLEIASADWKYEFDAARADGALFDAGWHYRDGDTTTGATPSAPPASAGAGSNEIIMEATNKTSPQFILQPSSEDYFATDKNEFFLGGAAPAGSTKIIVNGYQLSLFSPEKGSWTYKASTSLGTLKDGENEFIVGNQNGEFDRIKIFYSPDAATRDAWLAGQKTSDQSNEVATEAPKTEPVETKPTETNSNNLRLRYKDDQPLALKLLISEDQPEFLKVAEEIARQWRERGVKLTIERLPSDEFLKRLNKRDYDIILFGQNLGYNLDAYSFWHSSEAGEGGSNLSNLRSSSVNAWLEQVRSSFDSSERRKRLANLREVLSEEVPAVMLYTPTYSYAIDKKIKGFNLGHIALKRDRLANLPSWYLREGREASGNFGIWNFVKWFFTDAFKL
ncbi:MAG: ABC transporter substrate-binding protein [Patescibacteria group bacterium]